MNSGAWASKSFWSFRKLTQKTHPSITLTGHSLGFSDINKLVFPQILFCCCFFFTRCLQPCVILQLFLYTVVPATKDHPFCSHWMDSRGGAVWYWGAKCTKKCYLVQTRGGNIRQVGLTLGGLSSQGPLYLAIGYEPMMAIAECWT